MTEGVTFIMCKNDHPLATFGTISWQESSVLTPRMPRVGSECIPLIPSFGHNCGFGSIRWPQLQTGASDPQTNRLNLVLSHDSVVRVKSTTRTTKGKTEPPDAVGKWFEKATESIWPVADGSLSLRKSP